MKYQKKLIEWMKFKDQFFKRVYEFEGYFLKEDEEDILKWENSISEDIWFDIKEVVPIYSEMLYWELYRERACPYCYKHKFDFYYAEKPCNISNCAYAKNHRCCEDTESDWSRLESKAKTVGSYYTRPQIKEIQEKIKQIDQGE